MSGEYDDVVYNIHDDAKNDGTAQLSFIMIEKFMENVGNDEPKCSGDALNWAN